jgi:thioredoxin 1
MAVGEVTDATFENDVLKSEKPVIVDFWAPWCVPCRRVSPILEEMSEQREDVRFVKLNVDDNPATTMNYSISSIPTIARFEGGHVTQQAIGALPKNQLSEQLDL